MPRPWSSGLLPSWPASPLRTEEDIERDLTAAQRRAERLVDVLQALAPDDPPPTLPDADEGALVALAVVLEERIARRANARGHRFARRDAGRPIVCPACARPIDRAAEPCLGR